MRGNRHCGGRQCGGGVTGIAYGD
eukprot:COSAG02_NODE_67983_length_251_cov_1.361842_1_plen_23_part_01